MRLPNGYGSITKLSGNRRRPYWVRKTTGIKDNGQQIFHTVGYFASNQEAITALADFNKKDLKDYERIDITLKDLYEEWYKRQEASVSQGSLSTSSLEGYRTAYKHLKDLANMKVRDIKKKEIQDVIDGLYDSGFSKSAMTKVKSIIGQLMDYAMGDDILDKNYAKLVKIPTVEVAEKNVFTDMEIFAIENLAKNDFWTSTILILIYTGLRAREFINLTKFNIDIDHMIITGGAKTDAGKNRIIPIHPKIQWIFKDLYKCQGEYLLEIPGKTLKNKVDNYRRNYYYPALEKSKVRKLSPHTCRHTFGTLMNKAGVDTVALQKIIGHSDYSTTANIYTHPDIQRLRKEIEKI